ncbi:MAG TPA: hypothetical protein VIU62_16255, partial [Chloroflexota bacterium]
MSRLLPSHLQAGSALLIVLVLIACGPAGAGSPQPAQVRPLSAGPALAAVDGGPPSIRAAATLAVASVKNAAAPPAAPAGAPPAAPAGAPPAAP